MTTEVTEQSGNMAASPAPPWRREPYRLFFPVGLALAWAGVLHWLLHAVGALPEYRPIFHAMAQIQGFMTCLAVGFLFTAIPRRTGTSPPSTWQMVSALVLPVATTVAAWQQRWGVSQVLWVSLVVFVLAPFVVRRFRSREAKRRPPTSFVWIPVSFGMGVLGSILTSALGILGPDYYRFHQLGQTLVLQGMFLGLIVGVGSMIVPLITRGDSPPDVLPSRRDRWSRSAHLSAAAALVGSFVLEVAAGPRWGYAARAAVLFAVLLLSARIWRRPLLPGWHRRLVWLSAWMIPAGYVLGAMFPGQKKAGLHVVFIAGFALMAFAVAHHVTLAHGGYRRLLGGRPWQVPAYGLLLLGAAAMRAMVDFDPDRFFRWIGLSASAFLLASIFWAAFVAPRLWRESSESHEP